jgi:predicted DNA binding protein
VNGRHSDAMRYLTIRLTSDDVLLHPLVPTLTDGSLFREALMLDWTVSLDPPRSTVLLYLDGDLGAFEAVLTDREIVLEHDVTDVGGDRGYAYVYSEPHPTEWALFETFSRPGLVVVSPIRYADDGSVSIRLVGSLERLRAAVEAIPETVETDIERVGEYDLGRPAVPGRLSDRQQEALTVAFEAGYYEVPREATRAEVAAALDCAPSTASEHLRKAERKVVRAQLGRDR